MKKNGFLFMISVVIITTSGFSRQNKSILIDTITIKEVVITGTPIKVNKNNVPMAVSVVTRQQISESNESALLPVLNGLVPSLFVTERGITGFGVSSGAAGQITIRGIGGNPTTGILMLIDGHPQFMGIFGHPLSDSYVASDVERVEVIRGPASILYGSNAMGGVINIITRKQTQDGFHGDARLMFGSYNTQKYLATGGFKKDKFSVFASINHDQTDGHRPNSDFKITNGYIKVGYELTKNIKTNTDFSLAKFKTTDPGPDTLEAQPGSSLDITRGYLAFTVENDFEKYSGNAKAFYNFGTHIISDGFHSTDNNYGLNISESVKLFRGNSITIGGDYTKYGGKAAQDIGSGNTMTFVDTTVYEIGVFGFVQQTLFEKLTLNSGIRLQNNEVYGSEWIPSGGFSFKVTPATIWKASVGKGFRSPTIRELFMWNHNPDLNPERIMNYETGIRQSFFKQKLNIELTGFIVKGNNMIVPGNMGQLFNAGEIDNKGIEFAANVIPAKKLSFNLTYSYINMKNPVYATPRSHLFLSGTYKLDKFQFSASFQQINHLNTVYDGSAPHFQDYTLVNTKISYLFWKSAEIYISGNNLLNQKYETVRYYPMPGFTFFGGLNFQF
jgi:outer membrane receptor protein involved in Fe transport